jgi:hypothetical protein
MEAALVRLVRRRAGGRCEYCQMPAEFDALPFHVDHIIARQHGGPTRPANLAFACYSCNLHKGPNLAGRDRKTNQIVRLFHPRRQRWTRHFRWRGARLIGRTACGRATIATFQINHPDRVQLRRALIREGVFPPGPDERA